MIRSEAIKLVAAKVCLGSSLALGLWQCSDAMAELDKSTQGPQACQEDMPCWDCHTMGNLVCGPQGSTGPQGTLPADQVPDLTYCPTDQTWSDHWHWCPGGDPTLGHQSHLIKMATGPNAWDLGAYVGGYN